MEAMTVVGYVVLAVLGVSILMNLKDIRRYIKITRM